jgi:hypothetical protein
VGFWPLDLSVPVRDYGRRDPGGASSRRASPLSLSCRFCAFPCSCVVFLQAFLERGDRFWSLKIVKGRKRSKVAVGDAVDAGSGVYKHLREVHIVPMRLLLLLSLSLSLSLSLLVSKNCWLRRPLASSVVNRTRRMVAWCLFSILQ